MKTRQPDENRAARDGLGRFGKGNQLGPGRPKGSRDKRPRRGSIKAVYFDLIKAGDGHEKMVKAIDAGIQADPKTALGYLELGAKVLDKTDDTAGRVVHFHLHTNVDIYAMGSARAQHGLPPVARRVDPE